MSKKIADKKGRKLLATTPPDPHTMAAGPPTHEVSSTRLEIKDVTEADGITRIRRLADNGRCPTVRAAVSAMPITKSLLGEVDLTQTLESLRESVRSVQAGEMRDADAMLVSQADTLDGLFHLLIRRSTINSEGGYLNAAEAYMRLALKAQSQARSTWESISKIKNPVGATFIRQANMANGPQQVNNGPSPGLGSETSTRDGARARAQEIEYQPNELNGGDCREMDSGATGAAVGGDTPVATVGKRDRAANG